MLDAQPAFLQECGVADLAGDVLGVFARRGAAALFVSELHAELGHAVDPADLTAELQRLDVAGRLRVVSKASPDPHLDGADLRIVALVSADGPRPAAEAQAQAAVETAWGSWLREFLASHRCT